MPRHVTFPREPRRSVSRAAAKSAFTSSRGLYEARNIHHPNRKPHDPREYSPAESHQTHEKGHRSAPNIRDDKSIVWNEKRVRRAIRGQYGDLGKERGWERVWGDIGTGTDVTPGPSHWPFSPVLPDRGRFAIIGASFTDKGRAARSRRERPRKPQRANGTREHIAR